MQEECHSSVPLLVSHDLVSAACANMPEDLPGPRHQMPHLQTSCPHDLPDCSAACGSHYGSSRPFPFSQCHHPLLITRSSLSSLHSPCQAGLKAVEITAVVCSRQGSCGQLGLTRLDCEVWCPSSHHRTDLSRPGMESEATSGANVFRDMTLCCNWRIRRPPLPFL
jgi:hypothetical protein